MGNEVFFLGLIGVLVVVLTVPGTYMIYHNIRDSVEMGKRIDVLEKQLHDERAARAQLHIDLARVSIRLDRQIAYSQTLADIMRHNKIDVPPSPEERDDAAAGAVIRAEDADYDPARLLRKLAQHFNIDELNDLAFQLNIQTGDLGGESFNARARALIGNVQRNGRLADLVALCRQLRPNAKF